MSALIKTGIPLIAFLLLCSHGNGNELPGSVVHKTNSTLPSEEFVIFHLKPVENLSGGKRQGLYGEADIELEPTCPCSNSQSICDHTCCYCHLQCRLPEGVLTKRKWLQDVYESCSPSQPKSLPDFKSRLFENSKRIEWMCDERDVYMNSFKTTFYPILCVYVDNSIPLGGYYTLSSGPMTISSLKSMVTKILYSWEKTTTNELEINEELNEAEVENEEQLAIPTSNNNPDYLSLDEELCESMEIPPYITKARKECLNNQYLDRRLGSSMLGCKYTITKNNFTTLDELRNILQIAKSEIIARQIAKETPEFYNYDIKSCRNASECGVQHLNMTSPNCSCLPFHVNVTIIISRGRAVGILQDFIMTDAFKLDQDFTLGIDYFSYPLEKLLPTGTRLTRFWDKFYHEECPEGYCWRDIMRVETYSPKSSTYGWTYLVYTQSKCHLIVLLLLIFILMNIVYVFQFINIF